MPTKTKCPACGKPLSIKATVSKDVEKKPPVKKAAPKKKK